MRIAVLADIHGNSLALDAVLAQIAGQGGVDETWILGDLCAVGCDPAGVVEQIKELRNAVVIRGNVDWFVTTGERPFPTIEDARRNPELIPVLAEVEGSFGWTQGYLAACGQLEWLAALPAEQHRSLPDGTRALLTHAAPGEDDGSGLNPALTDAELEAKLAGCEAGLICVGHFHAPMERRLGGWHAINPGSVSNPLTVDLRAAYAIIDATERGYTVRFHRCEYDRAAAIRAMEGACYPGAAYVRRFLEGKVRASWMAQWDGVSYLPETVGIAKEPNE